MLALLLLIAAAPADAGDLTFDTFRTERSSAPAASAMEDAASSSDAGTIYAVLPKEGETLTCHRLRSVLEALRDAGKIRQNLPRTSAGWTELCRTGAISAFLDREIELRDKEKSAAPAEDAPAARPAATNDPAPARRGPRPSHRAPLIDKSKHFEGDSGT